jgi:transcriptional repressor NrdR
MRCPSCGSLDTQVKDSRPTEDSAVIRRRRVCLTCNFRFTTFERVQLRELTVIKRNGRRVPFDRDKLMRSVQIALRKRAVEPERIEQMVSKIVRELESGGESEVSSEAIGETVMAHLREIDDVAYVRFASVYRNFGEVKDFRAALDELSGDEADVPPPVTPARKCRPTTPATWRSLWRWAGAASAIPGRTRRSAR